MRQPFRGAAIRESRLAERDGPIERGDEAGRHPLDRFVADPVEPVGQKMSRRQHVAQFMIDLADRKPEFRKTPLLAQFVREPRLHLRQRLLGQPDLVSSIGRTDNPGGIFRIAGEIGDVASQPPHRPNDDPLQRKIEEARGDRRDQQRNQQNVAGEFEHRRTQGARIENQFDEIDSHARSHHADGVVSGIDQRLQSVTGQRGPGRIPEIDGLGNLRRHVARSEE